jgi:hypothetical protein
VQQNKGFTQKKINQIEEFQVKVIKSIKQEANSQRERIEEDKRALVHTVEQ